MTSLPYNKFGHAVDQTAGGGGAMLWNNYQQSTPHNSLQLGGHWGYLGPPTEAGGLNGGPRRRSRSAKLFRTNKKDWIATTKLGRLVKNGYVTSLEEILRYNVPITEVEIIDYLARGQLTEEVFAVFPIVKQTSQGSRTRFKTLVAVGDKRGHVGVGIKCYKEIASAIRGAANNAKTSMIQVVRGKWMGAVSASGTLNTQGGGRNQAGNDENDFHTIAGKVSGESGSTKVRLLPAPRGVGVIGAICKTQVTLLELAGIEDCYIVCSSHNTTTISVGNHIKAIMNALQNLTKLKPHSSGQYPEDVEKISSVSSEELEINMQSHGLPGHPPVFKPRQIPAPFPGIADKALVYD